MPTISFFGVGSPKVTAPIGRKVRILKHCFPCKGNSCNNSDKTKEKFTYERVKEDTSNVQTNMISNNIILNSNDQMKFDKKVIRVNSNQKVTLKLNHTGKFPGKFVKGAGYSPSD